jgi:acyl dehydratase
MLSGSPRLRGPRGRRRVPIPSRTITEALFAAFQTASADNHPIHYDREYCRRRGHPDCWRTASRC